MIRLLLLYTFLILLYSGCREAKISKPFRPIAVDTVFSKHDKWNEEVFTDLAHKMNLPLLQNGVDSFEYRLWLHISADILNLIRVRYEHSRWIVSETIVWTQTPDYDFRLDDTINHMLATTVDSTKTRALQPIIELDAFIDSLQFFNLEQAPSNNEIAGSFYMSTDAIMQTFELADKRNYRRISYVCPGTVVSLKEFHDLIENLLKFLKRNLRIEFRPC